MAGETSSDEKLMAALSYWGSIILWFVPALVIFLLKKDESAFIKKHSLQALVINVGAFAIVGVALSLVSAVIGVLTFGIGSLIIMLVQVCISLGLLVYIVVLGVQVFQGSDPDIPYVTSMLQKNLG
jgi:uncharacterized protein